MKTAVVNSIKISARNELLTFLYVVIFGVLPFAGLVSLFVWYTRNNGGVASNWKKAASSAYVFSHNCFSWSRKPKTTSTSASASSSSAGRVNDAKVFTISNGSLGKQQQRLGITKKDLVSTTNPDILRASETIASRPRSSHEMDIGASVAERIQRLQSRNTMNLKVDTRLPRSQSNSTTAESTPRTAETEMLISQTNARPVAPFYHKKPPLPPDQSLNYEK